MVKFLFFCTIYISFGCNLINKNAHLHNPDTTERLKCFMIVKPKIEIERMRSEIDDRDKKIYDVPVLKAYFKNTCSDSLQIPINYLGHLEIGSAIWHYKNNKFTSDIICDIHRSIIKLGPLDSVYLGVSRIDMDTYEKLDSAIFWFSFINKGDNSQMISVNKLDIIN